MGDDGRGHAGGHGNGDDGIDGDGHGREDDHRHGDGDDRHDGDDHHHGDDHHRGDGRHHDHHHHGDGDGDDHHHHDLGTVRYAVVTVSSSREIEEDEAGDLLVGAIDDAGHEVAQRELVADDYDTVQERVGRLADRDDVDVIVTTGGTGVTPDDVTVEAAEQLFEKRLPGFGELFRALSREEVGTRVVGTRATAGIVPTDGGGVPAFCLPGSTNAVRLGIEEVVLPEAGHLAGLASRGTGDDDGDEGTDDDGHGDDDGEGTDADGDDRT